MMALPLISMLVLPAAPVPLERAAADAAGGDAGLHSSNNNNNLTIPHSATTPRFSNVFGSHMVLQRGRPIKVWGFGAAPDTSNLTVHFGAVQTEAYWPVNVDGSWRALLPALPGAPCDGTALVLKLAGTVVESLADVCIGDVHLFSGQSNIDIPEAYGHQFSPADQAAEEKFANANGDIRLMIVPNQVNGLEYTAAPAKELGN
eukprot:SAG31_NODE_668_length_12945_cov_15.915849_2_plen_203_part_00